MAEGQGFDLGKAGKLIGDILKTEDEKVDFDLDNWIKDFEDGFPRFEKINPIFKQNYWGVDFEHRPRIKELNEQSDAQQVEGYRLVEFFPDREIKEESFLLFGTPIELMTQITFLMNMNLMLRGRDLGAWIGYPVDEYARAKPRTEVTVTVILTTYKDPPFYSRGVKWFSKRQVTIPVVDKSKITFNAIRNACGGSQGQNWGEWQARAYISLEDETKAIHQMVAGGKDENSAVANLEKFLPFSQCKLRGLTVNKIDYSKGDRSKDPNKNRYNNFEVYPAWISILNTRLVELDDRRGDGKKTLSGKMISKRNKFFTWMQREPSQWQQEVNELMRRSQ